MLACRPMLSFALAVMAGAAAARLRPDLEAALFPGWVLFSVLTLWFAVTPGRRAPLPGALPSEYVLHIMPSPGFFARRGLNRLILVACLGFFLIGGSRQFAWERKLSPGLLPEEEWFDATLVALAPRRDYEGEEGIWRIPALLLAVDGQFVLPVRVRLSGPDLRDFRRGDMVSARVRRDREYPKSYPGAFDFRLWMERDGLAASLSVVSSRRTSPNQTYAVIAMDDVAFSLKLRRMIDAVRAAGIRHTLRYGGGQGPALAAMIYGYRKELDGGLRDAFRRSGIGHVLAISGLHVGLIVGLLWWASGWLGWTLRWRAVSCLILAVVYLGLAGGQVAASRATVMAVIHLGGIVRGRRSDMLNSLGAAAFFLTLANPSAPMDVSFQLSFTAVVFIYLGVRGGEKIRERRVPADADPLALGVRIGRELRSLTRLSIATWFGLFPIVALAFNQVNLIGLPINIFVIPFMSLVLACGLLLPVLGWIPGFAWLLRLPSLLLAQVAAGADRLPWSSFPAHAPAGIWIFVFYLLVGVLLLRGAIPEPVLRRRWESAAGLAIAVSFIAMAASMRSSPAPDGGRVAVLPGRELGMIVAESPEGGMALLGTISRGGMDAAGWLHHLRRAGDVAVVAAGGAAPTACAAFSYHYPHSAFVSLPAKQRLPENKPVWREVDGAPGVWFAVSRDAKGKIAWLAVRAGERSVCVTPGIAARQLSWRLENRIPGYDAELICSNFSDSVSSLRLPAVPSGKVAISGRFAELLSGEWLDRRRFGVFVTEGGVIRGFDGTDWVEARNLSAP